MKDISNFEAELSEALRLVKTNQYDLAWHWLEQAEDTLSEIEDKANADRARIINNYHSENM